jgi:hypothetical protein
MTTMAQPKITLYIDVVSPFAYEAFYILQVRAGITYSLDRLVGCTFASLPELASGLTSPVKNDPVFKHVQITYVPIFLGGLFKTVRRCDTILGPHSRGRGAFGFLEHMIRKVARSSMYQCGRAKQRQREKQ